MPKALHHTLSPVGTVPMLPPQIVVGCPLIVSRANLEFWFFLVGIPWRGNRAAERLLDSFPSPDDALAVKQWNAEQIAQVGCALGGEYSCL